MNRFANFFASLFILAAFFNLAACEDNSNGNGNGNGGATPNPGDWKVAYFWDKQDETGYYTAYTFSFENDGSLTAQSNGQTWEGTWQTGFDDSEEKFLINFSGTVPSALSELEEDWGIIEMTDQLMHLEHTSGGNGDTDVVKFEKI